MIHEEVCNYLLRNVSRTEFDVCLSSILHSDWDGNIRLDLSELAEKSGTTKKYLKDIIKRFTSAAKGRFVFSKVEGREGLLYRFNIGKTSLQYDENIDRYCKKYKFFYTKEFQALTINAKRLILMAAFEMSVLNKTEISIKTSKIIPPVHNEETMPFTQARLEEAIKVIQASGLKDIVKVGLASHRSAKKELVHFSFAQDTLDEFYKNYTERDLLREKLFEAGYNEFFADEFCNEIQKVAKYIYRSFFDIEKELQKKDGVQVGAKDELQKLARFIYDAAIERLVPALNSKKEELDLSTPKKVSAYFSSIVFSLVAKEMSKYAHQANSIKSLLDRDELHQRVSTKIHGEDVGFFVVDQETTPIEQRYNFYLRLQKTLHDWCQNWIISRVDSIADEAEALKKESKASNDASKNNEKKEEMIGRIKKLKKTAFEQLDTIKDWIKVVGNRAIESKERVTFIEKMKDDITSYLAVHKDKIQQRMEIFEIVS